MCLFFHKKRMQNVCVEQSYWRRSESVVTPTSPTEIYRTSRLIRVVTADRPRTMDGHDSPQSWSTLGMGSIKYTVKVPDKSMENSPNYGGRYSTIAGIQGCLVTTK